MLLIESGWGPLCMMKRLLLAICISLATCTGRAQSIDDEPDIAYAHVYGVLGIHLPVNVANDPTIKRHLDELKRESCDQTGVQQLADALVTLGYRREAAESLYRFVQKCSEPIDALQQSVDLLLKLSDYPQAVEVADYFVRHAPSAHDAYYLRGRAFDGMGDYASAIKDYAAGIELFPDKKEISSLVFIHMAKAYASLGRFCEAMTPIETWVAYAPETRDTSAARKIIDDYAAQGHCALPQGAKSVERFALRGSSQVVTAPVELNHVRGRFVIDTGASYVSIQEDFAKRVGINLEKGWTIKLSTANGATEGRLTTADDVKLGSLQAKTVSVVVQSKIPGNYGANIDGLLGMSFLSRFDIHVANGFIELRAKRGQ